MTYNVFGGTLKPAQLWCHIARVADIWEGVSLDSDKLPPSSLNLITTYKTAVSNTKLINTVLLSSELLHCSIICRTITSFWGTSPTDFLPGLCSWTPMRDFRPRTS